MHIYASEYPLNVNKYIPYKDMKNYYSPSLRILYYLAQEKLHSNRSYISFVHASDPNHLFEINEEIRRNKTNIS